MDINILVGPVYERQRAQSTDIPNSDVNHALCVPMGIHIGRVGLYAGMPSLDMLHYPQADRQLERLLIEASVTSSLLCPTDRYQRAPSTDISKPDINHALCVPMSIHIGRVGLYAGMPSLDILHYPQADYHRNAY